MQDCLSVTIQRCIPAVGLWSQSDEGRIGEAGRGNASCLMPYASCRFKVVGMRWQARAALSGNGLIYAPMPLVTRITDSVSSMTVKYARNSRGCTRNAFAFVGLAAGMAKDGLNRWPEEHLT